MEKINYGHSNNPAVNEFVQSLKENKDVQSYCVEKGWNINIVDTRVIAFSNWLKDHNACKECMSLEMCPKHNKGTCIEISKDGNENFVSCKYRQEKIGTIPSWKKQYTICHLGNEALNNSLGKIDLSNEEQEYKSIVSMCQQWVDEPSTKGLYFHGGLGVGKTFLASCISNALAKHGYEVCFVNMPRLTIDISANMEQYGYLDDIINKMRNSYLLVIDDIGAEKLSDWMRDSVLFTTLDYRMENKKRTIFTSNCKFESLKNRMSSSYTVDDETKALRIIERVKALTIPIDIKGTSRRKL